MDYIGSELIIFSAAHNWRKYWQSFIPGMDSNLKDMEVLDVGAGLGSVMMSIHPKSFSRWVALEPDKEMFLALSKIISNDSELSKCEARHGTIQSLNDVEKFDLILYIDVLEHIKDDAGEIANAVKHLKDGGYLVVLVPANMFLFSRFDSAIGHFRRYSKKTLCDAIPVHLNRVRILSLDSVGMFASLTNKFLLKSGAPSKLQIFFWDNLLVKISKMLDPLLMFYVGKSIMGIWRK
jgi:SAM-dependent methyltransferase